MANNSGNDPKSYSQLSTDVYFAAMPVNDLLPYLQAKAAEYYEFVYRYRILDRWKRAYLTYYGMTQIGNDTTRLSQSGQNGEEFVLKVNDTRSLMQNLMTMTSAQRPSLEPKASNTDAKSMNQTILARTVLDYYFDEKHIEEYIKNALEFCIIAGQGYVVLDWNAKAGRIYQVDPTTKAPIYDGDIEAQAFHPLDVVRECWSEGGKNKWYIIREFFNKFDLAAKYPTKAQEIISVNESSDFMRRYSNIYYDAKTNADWIPVWTFIHDKSAALPNGRYTKYVGKDIELSDGPMPFEEMPVYQMQAAAWHGTPFGYAPIYDLMGIQVQLDALNSFISTGQINYGLQNILLPRGGEYNVLALAQGLNAIEYDPKIGEPKPLNLLNTPKEIFENIERLEKKQETLSGVNSVARGNVDRDMSGSALALIASQAVQFNGNLQESYNSLLENVGTGIIKILQEYASTPRMMTIAGKSNRARIKEFLGSDLDGIQRVTCEQVNAVSKTSAGRITMAQDLLKSGLIRTPQHYFEVLMTGTLDSLYEHETSQILMIRSENEDLSDGKIPQAVLTDKHQLHIQEHSTVLDSPEARSNPQIVKAMTAHIQQHINLLKTTDPALLNLLGEQSLAPQAQPPQGPPPQPGQQHPQPPNPHAPPGQHPGGKMTAQPMQAPGQNVPGPKQPNMPNVPKGTPQQAQEAFQQLQSNKPQV